MTQKKPCNVCNERPKMPGRGRRTCEQCAGLCKHCKGPVDDRQRCRPCIKKRNADRYKNEPGYAEEKRIKNKLSYYGITREEYDALGSVCFGCGATEGLVIDHDHATGKVRGRLCHGCNVSIGLLRENLDTMRNLITYLEAHSGSQDDARSA